MRKIFTLTSIFLLFFVQLNIAQVANFNLDEYRLFFQQHQNMSYSQIAEMHPIGVFNSSSLNLWDGSLFSDTIMQKYALTDYELSLIRTNGFSVTERLSKATFAEQFADIFHKDLPVFISTDAILHAFHQSYDRILKDCEVGDLIPRVTLLLTNMKEQIPVLETRYANNPVMLERLKDLDFYIGVPRKLLDENAQPYYSLNNDLINTFVGYVLAEIPQEVEFLSDVPRKIDFSQFKPRGHYIDIMYPELEKYFRALMWLGRIELYLIEPKGVLDPPSFSDVQRQTIVSYLMLELIDCADNITTYNNIEEIINFFVGYQDNVTLNNLQEIKTELNFENAGYLADSTAMANFQDVLAQKSYAAQMILSQMLVSNDISGDSIKPASAFMLYGQRFVVDSYVTGSVVYDKIRVNGVAVTRMLPLPLDVLFSLGNDAALQLLQNELGLYGYSQNLASLRYLIDSYQDDFWNYSFYNSWLKAIKTLNPPAERTNLPDFMQTGAWWQEKMNTQLASWAELRHDNLLYAKQSYTGVPICSYPYSYVEPYPYFYLTLKDIASRAIDKFNTLPFSQPYFKNKVMEYFNNLKNTSDTLAVISQKELDGVLFSSAEKLFLQQMLRLANVGCTTGYDGWYVKLLYEQQTTGDLFNPNYIIADYHTSPADESGAIVGWVKHAGTGNVDLLVTAVKMPDDQTIAFIGPVYSFYDYLTSDFLRLTDTEWREEYLNLALRPDWVNIYLANNNGQTRGPGTNLITKVEKNNLDIEIPNYLVAQNYPNPFNASTLINFSIPASTIDNKTELIVYNINGEVIKNLLNENLQKGNYVVRWDGTNNLGIAVASGVYLYNLKCGSLSLSKKMIMIK
ncbi:MAG: DUF3160 domain-containing protein [bacterium]